MAVSIELNEIQNLEIREAIERTIRDCIGNRPADEDWKVWIHASARYCKVVVKGPVQKREQLFFDGAGSLEEKIRNWLEMYPLR